jgi:GT2 family glycosyltransferase
MSDLAIIIVSWNVEKHLRKCLASVQNAVAVDGVDAEVWVVDNASRDRSLRVAVTEFPWTAVVASRENLGFAKANNVAMRSIGFTDPLAPERGWAEGLQWYARREVRSRLPKAVLLLNPDARVQPGALKAMGGFMSAHPQTGIVGARLRFGDGSFQHGAYAFPGVWQLAIELLSLPGRLYESRLNGRYPRRLYQQKQPFSIDHPLGAAMMVRAEAIRQVGLLDEGYRMYVEEVDWAKRIKSAGWEAYCVPAAQIIHLGGQSTGQVKAESFANLWRSRQRFYSRYYAGWKYRLASKIVQIGMSSKMKASPELADVFQEVKRIWQQ